MCSTEKVNGSNRNHKPVCACACVGEWMYMCKYIYVYMWQAHTNNGPFIKSVCMLAFGTFEVKGVPGFFLLFTGERGVEPINDTSYVTL